MTGTRRVLWLIAIFTASCGIKAPPRPPLLESAPAPTPAPEPSDAGCCQAGPN